MLTPHPPPKPSCAPARRAAPRSWCICDDMPAAETPSPRSGKSHRPACHQPAPHAARPHAQATTLRDAPRHARGARSAALDGQLTHDGVAGERSDLCDLHPAVMAAPGFGDTAMTHAGAILRVLKDGLITIFARCRSSAAGRGNAGLWALPLTGGLRWYVRAGRTLEDAGMWASSPHTTQSGSAGSRMGPTCDCLFSLAPAAGPPSHHPRFVPSAGRSPGATAGPYPGLVVNGWRRSHRSRPDLHDADVRTLAAAGDAHGHGLRC